MTELGLNIKIISGQNYSQLHRDTNSKNSKTRNSTDELSYFQ